MEQRLLVLGALHGHVKKYLCCYCPFVSWLTVSDGLDFPYNGQRLLVLGVWSRKKGSMLLLPFYILTDCQ